MDSADFASVGDPQRFQTSDGVALKFTDVGPRDAPALLFLHGEPPSAVCFACSTGPAPCAVAHLHGTI